ncbi:unnamed protein product [Ostreobium quekettii]|uniref:Uncharacterized protein n=1 Tax=Ostreobium quekettii TaxID=121088 RepID=A0A8S1IK36_9CHLO|nr:unnamed protein product [Ostreobium quekettii]
MQHRTSITMATATDGTAVAAKATDKKLADLRQQMASVSGVDAIVVPTTDPNLMEYVPDYWKRRAFISGFTGSAGTAVITTSEAALWTDGRYFLQAERELGPEWTLMRMGTKDCPDILEWLCKVVPEGGRVGVDPFCHNDTEIRSWQRGLENAGRELVLLDASPVDAVWGAQRPSPPKGPLRVHPVELAGESTESKLSRIREAMTQKGATALVTADVSEVAWILNLRGQDELYSPIFISYLIVTLDKAVLYVDTDKVTEDVRGHLDGCGCEVLALEAILDGIREHTSAATKIWMSADQVNCAIFNAARQACREETADKIIDDETPIKLFMAVKNEVEIAGMKEAHLRDAVAIIEFLSWFEKQVGSGASFTEVEVDKELTDRRKVQDGFVGLSFPTIAGAGPNGAVIHYQAEEQSCRTVDKDTLLLIDSGAQYDRGTTDVTRTFHLGEPTSYQKECFTRVLQGHIQMDAARFPENTPGIAIDGFARMYLWQMGLDYLHGTGHGVGAHLCVHEGPMQISFRHHLKSTRNPLKANMIVSNEPGYYEDGNFGIRIENLAVIKEAKTEHNFRGTRFLEFEPITYVPIQKKMIAKELLSKQQVDWVNNYHAQVWDKVSSRPSLSPDAKEWLRESVTPL